MIEFNSFVIVLTKLIEEGAAEMKVYYDENIRDQVCHVSALIRAVSVEPQDDSKLLVSFSNGEQRIFDAAPLLDMPIYAPLREPSFFRRAHIECGTVVWSDELDVSPESLYEDSSPLPVARVASPLNGHRVI